MSDADASAQPDDSPADAPDGTAEHLWSSRVKPDHQPGAKDKIAAEDLLRLGSNVSSPSAFDKSRVAGDATTIGSERRSSDQPGHPGKLEAAASRISSGSEDISEAPFGTGHLSKNHARDPSPHQAQRERPDSDLEERMAKASLGELGWRERDDIGEMMRDLERLSHKDRRKAAALWCKFRPGDPDKPIFIDGDDKDPAPLDSAISRNNSSAEFAPEEPKTEVPVVSGTAVNRPAAPAIPPALAKRFLVAETKFYFRDDPNLLAFEDKGMRLATEHNDPLVARSMIELAKARNWGAIKVKGTDEFKREAWLAASARGIEVLGYRPTPLDIAKRDELRQFLAEQTRNELRPSAHSSKDMEDAPEIRVEPSSLPQESESRKAQQETYRNLSKRQQAALASLSAALAERGDSTKASEMTAQLAAGRFQAGHVYVGRLVSHGSAPYQNKRDNSRSYFVTITTPSGERTLWGVDLERAIKMAGIEEGDDIAISQRRNRRAGQSVVDPGPSDAGREKPADRKTVWNTWDASKLDALRTHARLRLKDLFEFGERNQPVVKVEGQFLPQRADSEKPPEPTPAIHR